MNLPTAQACKMPKSLTPCRQRVLSRLLIRSISTLIIFGFKATVANATCAEPLNDWIVNYGGSDPYIALNKTTPWRTDRELLNKILEKKDQERIYNHEDYTSILDKNSILSPGEQPYSFMQSALGPLGTQKPRASERDVRMRESLKKFFAASPQNELQIAFVGSAHAIDLFLAAPELPLTYVNKPFKVGTKKSTDEFYRAKFDTWDVPGNQAPEVNLVDDVKGLPYFYSLATARQLNQYKLPDKAFRSQSANKNQIIIGEYHEFVSSDWIQELPSAICLKQAYKVIKVGWEGFPKGKILSFNDIIRRQNQWDWIEFLAKKRRKSVAEVIDASMSTTSQQDFINGKTIGNVAAVSLIKRLAEYSSHGIEVNMVGVDEENYDYYR